MKNRNIAETIVMHENDIDNGSFANVLKKAVIINTRNKKKSNVVDIVAGLSGSSKLPKLTELSSLTEDEIAYSAKEAHKKKEWVEQAGPILLGYKQQQDVIRSTEDWLLSPTLVEQYSILTASIVELESAGDENLQMHLKFCEFRSLIREVNTPKQIEAVAHRLVSEKIYENGATRYRIISKDEARRRKMAGTLSSFAFFWNNKCYLPYEPLDGEEKSRGQKEIEQEVRKATVRLGIKRKTRILKKMEVLRNMKANRDLSFVLNGVAGLYMIEANTVRDSKNKKIIRHGGVAVIRLLPKRKIEPVDGAGCFDWISGEDGKWFISVGNAIFGKVPWDPCKDESPEDTAKREDKWSFIPLQDKNKAKRFACVLNKYLYDIYINIKI